MKAKVIVVGKIYRDMFVRLENGVEVDGDSSGKLEKMLPPAQDAAIGAILSGDFEFEVTEDGTITFIRKPG